jgi:glycerate kinase
MLISSVCKGGHPNPFFGRHLLELESIDVSPLEKIRDLHIDIACDVGNPFVGRDGAVHTFGKQKGLITQEMRDTMERGMINTANILRDTTGIDVSNMKGAGAAGGISGGFFASFNAGHDHRVVLKKGIEVIAEYVELEKHISESTLVITGEGCYDEQTAQGKVVSWVEYLCQKHNVPCVVVCGKSMVQSEPSTKHIVLELMSMFEFEQSMKDTAKCIEVIMEKHLSHFGTILGSMQNRL